MQRIGNLYTKLYSFENLHLAFKKAKRGTQTYQCKQFEFHLEKELLALSFELKNHLYQPSNYHYFTIYEPKERIISVASFRDRVVHHAIINLLEPIYEKIFICESYATRKNKGSHAAIGKAQLYLRQTNWFFKSDIKKYFDSIKHDILLNQIRKKIKDIEFLELIHQIIEKGGDLKALPIGNLTSQFFANIYLNEFDHFVKRNLKCKFYIRYMDDFVIFHKKKEFILQLIPKIKHFFEIYELKMNPNSSFVNQKSNGLSFLGVRIYPHTIRIKSENLKRCVKKINSTIFLFSSKLISFELFLNSLNSLFAHLQNFSTFELRKHWLLLYIF